MNTISHRADEDIGMLGLGSVLVGSLPQALFTENAPAHYTVEAVFSRKPDREEIEAILSAETASALTHAGYPDVHVVVSDRRLVISGTSLEELRDGLGDVLAARLAEISLQARRRRTDAAERFQVVTDREDARAARVAALAASVHFRADDASIEREPAMSVTTIDDPLGEWDSEGGSVRPDPVRGV